MYSAVALRPPDLMNLTSCALRSCGITWHVSLCSTDAPSCADETMTVKTKPTDSRASDFECYRRRAVGVIGGTEMQNNEVMPGILPLPTARSGDRYWRAVDAVQGRGTSCGANHRCSGSSTTRRSQCEGLAVWLMGRANQMWR